MLYVPTLNIVSPRARNIKIGNYSSQGKSRAHSSMTNNVDKNSDNENVADVDFAKLATLSTGQNSKMTYNQLFQLQRDNYALSRLQQVTEVKVRDENSEVVKNDLQDMVPSNLKLQEVVTTDQLKIEMAQKDLELRRALDAEKEYGRKIIGLQTELRYKNNAIIGLKKEFAQMVMSLESNIQMLKSVDESRKSVTLAVKKETAAIVHNDSSLTKNLGPRALPVHKPEPAKQKTSSAAVLIKAGVIDSMNKKFMSFETESKGLEDRIRNLEQLLLHQRSVEAADSSHRRQMPKPPEANTQLSSAHKNGRTISFVHRSGEPTPAHESLPPTSQAQAMVQPAVTRREMTYNSREAPSGCIGSEVHIPHSKAVPPPSSATETEITGTNSASPSDARKVSHPPSARPALTSPISASRKIRTPTPKGELVSPPSVEAIVAFSNAPPYNHGDAANQPTEHVGSEKGHDSLELTEKELSRVVLTHGGPTEATEAAVANAIAEQEPLTLSLPTRKENNPEIMNTEEASTAGGLDSSEATKRQKAALLKDKKKLKRIIHGRKDFFAKSGRDPTSEEQQLIDDELRRYTQIVKALKQFEDDNVE